MLKVEPVFSSQCSRWQDYNVNDLKVCGSTNSVLTAIGSPSLTSVPTEGCWIEITCDRMAFTKRFFVSIPTPSFTTLKNSSIVNIRQKIIVIDLQILGFQVQRRKLWKAQRNLLHVQCTFDVEFVVIGDKLELSTSCCHGQDQLGFVDHLNHFNCWWWRSSEYCLPVALLKPQSLHVSVN